MSAHARLERRRMPLHNIARHRVAMRSGCLRSKTRRVPSYCLDQVPPQAPTLVSGDSAPARDATPSSEFGTLPPPTATT